MTTQPWCDPDDLGGACTDVDWPVVSTDPVLAGTVLISNDAPGFEPAELAAAFPLDQVVVEYSAVDTPPTVDPAGLTYDEGNTDPGAAGYVQRFTFTPADGYVAATAYQYRDEHDTWVSAWGWAAADLAGDPGWLEAAYSGLYEVGDAATVPIVDQAIAMASEILYYLTGSKWGGVKTETLRPMAGGCGCGQDPVLRNNNRLRGVCPDLRQQDLGVFPLMRVDEVLIDGEAVDPARYRIDDRRYLVAVRATSEDERVWWPSCQIMDLPDTQEGTWSVTVGWGWERPPAGRTAAAALACEIALSLLPEDEDGPGCRLPKSWTSITRAGVSISRAAIQTLMAEGLTGLPEVDLWLASLERAKERQGSAVIVPGRPRDARRTRPPTT